MEEVRKTYALPPALRMMCASPSWMPSSAYTLTEGRGESTRP